MTYPSVTDLCEKAWPTNRGYTPKQKEWLGKLVAPLYREITDLLYMQEALVQMLGPKGREVWAMWQEQGVVRQHSSWAVDPMTLDGEEIAAIHLAWEEAPKTRIDNVDEHVHNLGPDNDASREQTDQD